MEDQKLPRPQKPTFEEFHELATTGKWDEFDHLAVGVSKDPSFLIWAEQGLTNDDAIYRDLAITLLENTTSPAFEERHSDLIKVRDQDEDPHLRRKATIALFKHGDNTPDTLESLRESYRNDPELRKQAGQLLGIDE